MAKAWYTSRDDVKRIMGNSTVKNDRQIDRAINTASDMIEGMLHRKFYPELATRSFIGSDFFVSSSGVLYLQGADLLSVSSFSVNGTSADYRNYFVSTESLETSDFSGELTAIDSADEIVITGVFGYTYSDTQEADLDGPISNTATNITVSDSSVLSVGHTIRIDNERLFISGKSQLASGQSIQSALDIKANSQLVSVSNGSSFIVGEVILIDAEKMLIVDIAGNNLIVERAYEGTTLASHLVGAAIYVPRILKVTRGVLGTTAASHADNAVIYRLTPPGLIQSLCIAETINILEQQKSGYARTIGANDNEREVGGRGLADIRKAAMVNYRKYRSGVV
jgi:hypothetical protein